MTTYAKEENGEKRMNLLYSIAIVLHVLVSLGLILTVLLQAGKGSSLSGAFGGGGGSAAFGGREAADFMSKLTTGLAVTFMVLSLVLVVLAGGVGPQSVLQSHGSAPPIPLRDATLGELIGESGEGEAPAPAGPTE